MRLVDMCFVERVIGMLWIGELLLWRYIALMTSCLFCIFCSDCIVCCCVFLSRFDCSFRFLLLV